MYVLGIDLINGLKYRICSGHDVGIGAVIELSSSIDAFLSRRPVIGGFTAGYIARRGTLLSSRESRINCWDSGSTIVVFVVVFAGMVSHPAARISPEVGCRRCASEMIISLYHGYHRFFGGAHAGFCQARLCVIFLKKRYYVPMSQLQIYFFCSFVIASMWRPSDISFRFATCSSIS